MAAQGSGDAGSSGQPEDGDGQATVAVSRYLTWPDVSQRRLRSSLYRRTAPIQALGPVAARGAARDFPGAMDRPECDRGSADEACPPQHQQPGQHRRRIPHVHYSAANLRFPGDDARLDLTDLFVFQALGDPDTAMLIIDLNPYTTGISTMPPFLMKSEFHPDGVYQINTDTDAHGERPGQRVLRPRFFHGSGTRDAAKSLIWSEAA